MISETITVDASEAIDSLNELAAAAEDVAGKFAGLDAKLNAGLGGAAAGPDKMIAAWDKAATAVSASVDKIGASIGKLDDLGALAGAAGPADLVAKWDTAAADIGASIDKIAAGAGKLDDLGAGAAGAAGSVGELGDALKGVGESGAGLDGAGAGLKGIGTEADAAASQLAALRAEMAATAAENDKLMASLGASADTTVAAGKASATYAEALPSLGTTSIEQDAAVVQAQQARKIASQQGAADASAAEASAGKYHMLALGAAAALGYGVYDAAKLQQGATRLVTSAGESASNIPADERGILGLSGYVDQSQANLLAGMYTANSGGFHGKNALAVERAAGEGATAEGASLGTVSNALTTLLRDYYGGPAKSAGAEQDQATSAMNAIMASVGSGKMTLQDLSSAMPVLLPTAKSAGLSLQQVLGAEATMTAQGTGAQEGAQEIRHTIGALQKPSGVQAAEMQMLGINPLQLESDLGKQGLTGTIGELDAAVKSHTKNGMVDLDTMNQSALAVQSANQEITALPKNLQGAAKEYLAGTMSESAWYGLTGQSKSTLSATDVNLLKQFATTANTAHGFSTLEKEGLGDKQTVTGALSQLLGGQMGQQVALQVGGANLKTFDQNVRTVGESAKQTGDNIKDWGDVQKTLSYQLGSSVNSLKAVATEAGQVALPTVTTALKGLADAGGFFASHQAVTQPLVESAGVLGALAVIPKLASAGTTLAASVGKVGEVLGVPGAGKLSSIGQGAAGDALASGAAKAGDALAAGGAKGGDALAAGAAKAAETLAAGGAKAGEADAAGGAKAGDELAAGGAKAAEEEEAGGGKGGGAIGIAGTAAIGLVIAKTIIDGLENKKNPRVLGNTNPSSWWNNNDAVGHAGKLFFRDGPGKVQESQFQSRFGISIPGTDTAAPKIPALDVSSLDKARAKVQAEMTEINSDISQAKAAHLPAPDISALDGVKSKIQSQLNEINAALNNTRASKVASPDLSALASAKATAAQAAAGIKSAADAAVGKPSKVASPDMSALAEAKSKAAADGAQIDLGLAQGIMANAAAAEAAAEHVAAQVEAAMNSALQVKSPSKVTEKIGSETVAGLVLGLEGGKGSVGDASAALAKAVTEPWSNGTTAATYKSLVAGVESAFKAGTIDKSQDSAAVAFLKSDTAKMQSLEHQRATIEANIKAADAYASNVQSTAISNASIVNDASAASAAENGSASTPAVPLQISDIIAQAQSSLAQMKQFQQGTAADKKMGLNTTMLGQIIQSGASTGQPIASAIASGGKGAVAQLNEIQAQTNAAAKQLGVTSANAMYESGSQIGAGLAAGLKGELGSVVTAIDKLAEQMVSQMKSELKISSPSQVFADLAMEVPAGAAMGVERGTGAAVAAVGRMGSAMAGSYHAPSIGAYGGHGGGYGSGSGGGATNITYHTDVHVTVNGSVSTQQDLVNAVARGLRTKANSNWQVGIIPQGRAG